MAQAQATRARAGSPPIPRYSMVLEWDPEGAIYVVSVPEPPGCHGHGATYEEAASKGAAVIAAWVGVLADSGLPIPPPREWRP